MQLNIFSSNSSVVLQLNTPTTNNQVFIGHQQYDAVEKVAT